MSTSARLLAASVAAVGLLSACTSSPAHVISASTRQATSAPSAATPSTTGTSVSGTATMTFLPALVRDLYTAGLQTAPAGDARLAPVAGTKDADALALPVTGGSLHTPGTAVTGRIDTTGAGIVITGTHTSLRVSDFAISLSPTPTVTATVSGGSGAAQTLTVFTTKAAGAASVTGSSVQLGRTPIYLTSAAVSAFDSILGTTVFAHQPAGYAGGFTASLQHG